MFASSTARVHPRHTYTHHTHNPTTGAPSFPRAKRTASESVAKKSGERTLLHPLYEKVVASVPAWSFAMGKSGREPIDATRAVVGGGESPEPFLKYNPYPDESTVTGRTRVGYVFGKEKRTVGATTREDVDRVPYASPDAWRANVAAVKGGVFGSSPARVGEAVSPDRRRLASPSAMDATRVVKAAPGFATAAREGGGLDGVPVDTESGNVLDLQPNYAAVLKRAAGAIAFDGYSARGDLHSEGRDAADQPRTILYPRYEAVEPDTHAPAFTSQPRTPRNKDAEQAARQGPLYPNYTALLPKTPAAKFNPAPLPPSNESTPEAAYLGPGAYTVDEGGVRPSAKAPRLVGSVLPDNYFDELGVPRERPSPGPGAYDGNLPPASPAGVAWSALTSQR